MGWAEAKWTVDQILQKIGQAPNNMRKFTAFSVSKTEIGLKFLEPLGFKKLLDALFQLVRDFSDLLGIPVFSHLRPPYP